MVVKIYKNTSEKVSLLQESELYIAFLDILGFQQLIDQADYPAKVEAIVQALKRRADFDGKRYGELRYLAISDTIIVTAELGAGRELARKVGQLQNALLKLGFALRGAINFGKTLTYDGSTGRNIFGRTYVDTYLAEKDRAIYPRVIIDKGCLDTLREDISESSSRNISTYILSDRDGVKFINQFSSQLIGLDSSRSLNRSRARSDIREFRSKISIALKETSGNPKANMKWRWLKRQFEDQLGNSKVK